MLLFHTIIIFLIIVIVIILYESYVSNFISLSPLFVSLFILHDFPITPTLLSHMQILTPCGWSPRVNSEFHQLSAKKAVYVVLPRK